MGRDAADFVISGDASIGESNALYGAVFPDHAKEALIIITVAGAAPINTYATNGITLTVEGA